MHKGAEHRLYYFKKMKLNLKMNMSSFSLMKCLNGNEMIFRYAVPLVHIASHILQISSVLCTSISLVTKLLQIAVY